MLSPVFYAFVFVAFDLFFALVLFWQPWCRRSQSPTQQPWWIRFPLSTWWRRPRVCNRSWEVSCGAKCLEIWSLSLFYYKEIGLRRSIKCFSAAVENAFVKFWWAIENPLSIYVWRTFENTKKPLMLLLFVLCSTQVCILLCWGCWQPTTPTSASWRTGCARRKWPVRCLFWGRWCCPSVPADTPRTSSTRVSTLSYK